MVTEIKSLKQLGELFASNNKVIIDFWAEWCGPCKITGPEFAKAASEVSTVAFAKVNVDEQTDIAAAYKITSLPTIVLFEKGQEKHRAIGFMPKAKIVQLVSQ
ncbi:thioredoxin [Mycoplasmoides pneumoniae]|uniref:Thioredoxin n=4 Tax=Mycoplasmoides pneumoniae TaxID=2104 RepID=THIO_MYCPN|nr:thioredoxin [Mycoplasmoides pneumoniae]P75512.1 RecName: Full=Thioredoxin; Short=Trx [Mycoplasmoides pneumoniae M129]AAB96218.1 thioredoxin [Mycoplasmoides pneumoniae M129]AAC45450.1 thioredoxin A65_orf102 [Mycoplasmoides pneumoniae]ADK86813.1 thioredoxin [Mycoplasmoides pneumoniae FH]AGC04188.1 thioredoxin [Mycoplasmoides pneumoniae M129-B7]ALA30145.1 thioredoxin [Mycoplasmoides pneumoniae PI 1428]